jgi:hypothetical protein
MKTVDLTNAEMLVVYLNKVKARAVTFPAYDGGESDCGHGHGHGQDQHLTDYGKRLESHRDNRTKAFGKFF